MNKNNGEHDEALNKYVVLTILSWLGLLEQLRIFEMF
jgi:hypothetical protein